MRRVIVVTDSSATVPAQIAAELDIQVVPITLAVNGRTFRDGVDVTASDVYRWQRSQKLIPTTAAPSVGDFLQVYLAAARKAPAILSIHVPRKLSAVQAAAATAAQLVDGVTIRVMDCPTAAIGQGFAVLEAARAAARGADLEEVAGRAEEVAAKVTLLATLDTLEYLHRGGRIGGAAALAGSVLQIKPIVCVNDGRVELFAKPRTKARAIESMLRHMADQVNGRPVHASIIHADAPEEATRLRERVLQEHRCVELYVTELTPVMGAHTGPGVLGLAFYTD